MTAARAAPVGWSADLCQVDSRRRDGGARATSAERLDLDGGRQLLFDVGGVRDHEYLAESCPEPGERTEEPIAVFAVECAEHLIEHQQADCSSGEKVDLFADRDSQRQVGEIRFRTGVPIERVTGTTHAKLEAVAVDLETVEAPVGQLPEQRRRLGRQRRTYLPHKA